MTTERARRDAVSVAAAVGMLATFTWLFRRWPATDPTTPALVFLTVVLVVATNARLWTAMTVALLADLSLNYFFMAPFGTLTVADPQNWVVLGVFLIVSFVSSSLSAAARDRAVARRGEELKASLLASLGHNLRTPLTTLRVAADNLQLPGLDDRDRREQSDLIRTEVVRLQRLFEHVLDMARLDAGALTSQTAWIEPLAVFEAARDQAGAVLAGRQVQVQSDTDDEICLDPRLTGSALAHVLENAAHYSPEAVPIEVSLSVTDRQFVASVRDHGPGIDSVDSLHIFEPFYRGATGAGRSVGTGMGLAIARGLLAVENGRIAAERAHGGGTIFTIEVPIAGRRPAAIRAS